MKVKKIAYVSGTRADFGLMSPVLKAIDAHPKLKLQLYATGVHLMPQFGNTIDHIRLQFPNVRPISAEFESDDRNGMAKFMGVYLQKAVAALNKNRPDFIFILGDRVEMLCTAMAAVYLGIPSGHLHGGERTSTVDELARHSITKLASLHFATSKDAARRIERMGEEPWRITVVGAPALDTILNEKLPTREELFLKLGINPTNRIILVAQHPVTEQIDQAAQQMETTIAAVKSFNLHTVVVFPHPDPGGRRMIKVIERERDNPLFHLFPSLEFKDFLALEREAAVMVGNTSAGMIESSSFKTPVVNIGIRQLNRLRGKNVIEVDHDIAKIAKAIKKSLDDQSYLKTLKRIKNPWGDGHAAQRIVKVLSEIEIDDKLLHKQITY